MLPNGEFATFLPQVQRYSALIAMLRFLVKESEREGGDQRDCTGNEKHATTTLIDGCEVDCRDWIQSDEKTGYKNWLRNSTSNQEYVSAQNMFLSPPKGCSTNYQSPSRNL